MGGTYAGYGDEVFALHGQPAANARRNGYDAGFQYNDWFGGVSQQFVGIQGPLGDGRWAVTGNILGASNIDRTTEDATGGFGGTSGQFSASDLAISANYSRLLSERLSIGISAKYIRSKLDNVSAATGAADIGVRYMVNDHLTLGGSVTNIGPGLKFLNSRSKLPTAGRLGAAYHWSRFLLAADAVYSGSDDLSGGIGLEVRPVDMLALRVGYRSQGAVELENGLTAGLGLNVGQFQLDYGYAKYGPLGNTHRFSADVSF